MPRGRPSKYDIKYCDVVLRLMKKGFSKDAIAGELGISRDTLYQWCQVHPEFSDTIKKGEAQSLLFWENIGIDGALGKIKNFNGAVWIFTMKSRFKWRDNPDYKEDPLDKLLSEPEQSPEESITETERMRRLFIKYGKGLEIAAQLEDARNAKTSDN